MSALRTIAIILVSCLVVFMSGCVDKVQNEFINARRLEAYQDMSAIRQAITKYTEANKTLPSSIVSLAPTFLSEDIVNRTERRDMSGMNILVPARPYNINPPSSGFEITCTFFGKGYTQLVMNVQGEVTVR